MGLEILRRYPGRMRHTELDVGNVILTLFEIPGLNKVGALGWLGEQGYLHFVFQTTCKRFPAVVRELKNKGVVINNGPIILGNGELVYFKDLDVNPLEIRCPTAIF